MNGVRLAIGLLTAVPIPVRAVDRRTAGAAMTLAPAVGLGLGAAAVLVGEVGWRLGASNLTAAVLALGTLALLTRALHLDGLADTADAIGSGKPPGEALAVMRRSDIGPVGVVALLFVLLLQVGALTGAYADGHGAASLVTAAVAGRMALAIACRGGVAAARPEGLGALVAGTVGRGGLTLAVGIAVLAAGAAGVLSDLEVWRALLAVVVVAVGGLLLTAAFVRRFGGISGDTLGALVEIGTAAALLVLA